MSTYYAKKSINNTTRGCYFLNDSLFKKYARVV